MPRSLLLVLILSAAGGCTHAARDIGQYIMLPEQRTIDHRDPEQVPPTFIPPSPPPRTVTDVQPDTVEWPLSLDEAVRIALENCQVVRVLTGLTAVSSGQTIYDAAITDATIDQAQATFDPILKWNNTWSRTSTPFGAFNPVVPNQSFIASTPTDQYVTDLGLTKTNVVGGQWLLNFTERPTRFAAPGPFPLNPQTPDAMTLSYTQPLLQGAGFAVNTAPIVIARLNTEVSFFQYKDSVQELVRSTIEGYWNLVQSRVTAWARKIQEEQSKEAFERESARFKSGFSDVGNVSQTRVTYNQFRADRIAADADVLAREGALRNLLGLPPTDNRRIVPTSVPATQQLPHDWNALVQLAQQRRPDVIELKIIVEADQVRLVQAENQALPKLDTTALYRWNGLSGTMPNDEETATHAGQFTDWSVGINFSVPLGLRQGRALARQQKLLIARDQANVEQAVHFAVSQIAGTIRDLDSAYAQYEAYRETRAAADVNLRVQTEKFRAGQTIYLNVLEALNSWGTAVSSEARTLLAYNVSLASLERQTGTILETHGLVFVEERFRAAGPLLCRREYPAAQPPAGAPHRYPGTGERSEDSFDLRNPTRREKEPPADQLPPPRRVEPRP